MKLSYFIIFLFYLNFSFSQTSKKNNIQEQYIIDAKKHLNEDNIEKAYIYFSALENVMPGTKVGIFASKKLDSIRTILRNNLLESIKGNWKLKNIDYGSGKNKASKTNLMLSDMLDINPSKITYYLKDKKKTKEETIKFADNEIGNDANWNELLIAKKNIWKIELNKEKKVLVLTNTGYLNKSYWYLVHGKKLTLEYEKTH